MTFGYVYTNSLKLQCLEIGDSSLVPSQSPKVMNLDPKSVSCMTSIVDRKSTCHGWVRFLVASFRNLQLYLALKVQDVKIGKKILSTEYTCYIQSHYVVSDDDCSLRTR